MREIGPPVEPAAFTEWRAGSQNDINYGYELIPGDLKGQIKDALIGEQRGLCAYTGIGVNADSSHIEHLLPQDHCQRGQDVAYANMVACYPAPNTPYVPFGALRKGNWPSPAEQHLFVSPRSPRCEGRFTFNIRGEISASKTDDEAAWETIKRLGLDHRRLEALRKEAIDATLQLQGRNPALLDLRLARQRLNRLEEAEFSGGRLEPFCFALKQALRKHIQRLQSIRESKKRERP